MSPFFFYFFLFFGYFFILVFEKYTISNQNNIKYSFHLFKNLKNSI